VIAIPALDLRDGCCVQLVGGRYEQERVRLKDPIQVAANWAEMGFRRLHVVDLDAATGRSTNRELVLALLSRCRMEIQVGGGIRSEAQIDEWLSAGARAVVVGTKAMEEPAWLRQMAGRYPGRLVIAADVRDRQVLSRGWQEALPLDIAQAIAGVNDLAISALLVTAVHKEGQMAGTDLELMEEVVGASTHPILASGGIARPADLEALAKLGVAGAILGMALYTGALDARGIAKEYST